MLEGIWSSRSVGYWKRKSLLKDLLGKRGDNELGMGTGNGFCCHYILKWLDTVV